MKVQIYLESNFYYIEDFEPTVKCCSAIVDIPEEKVEEYKYFAEKHLKIFVEICEIIKQQDPRYLDYVFKR